MEAIPNWGSFPPVCVKLRIMNEHTLLQEISNTRQRLSWRIQTWWCTYDAETLRTASSLDCRVSFRPTGLHSETLYQNRRVWGGSVLCKVLTKQAWGLSADPQHTQEPDMTANVHSSISRSVQHRRMDPWSSLASQSRWINQLQLQWETLLQNQNQTKPKSKQSAEKWERHR